MAEDWDFYLCEVDGKLASMFVDLAWIEVAPVEALPVRAQVRLRMAMAGADGLSSNEEFDALAEVEEALTRHLVGEDAAYVGRCTLDGFRDFYFYLADSAAWSVRLEAGMRAFPGYDFTVDMLGDADWLYYTGFLYPNDVQWLGIANRRACDRLQRGGDDLASVRPIEQRASFYDDASRRDFIEEARQLGYEVRALEESGEGEKRFRACMTREDAPRFDAIDGITVPLFEIVQRFDGDYEGWESAPPR